MSERTFVLIKPDAVRRGLTGRILDRYLARGLTLVAMQMRIASPELTDQHYAEHLDKPWYPQLRDFLTRGPHVALVVEGERAIEAVRRLNGATDALAAEPGSIRGDWSVSGRENLVHGSDSPACAIREITLWFPGLR